MKKLVALYSISNIVNIVARYVIIYDLLKLTVEPYEASMISSLCASGLSYLVTNLASNQKKTINKIAMMSSEANVFL
jgi:hypothetical protein